MSPIWLIRCSMTIIKLYQHNKWPIKAPSSYYKSKKYCSKFLEHWWMDISCSITMIKKSTCCCDQTSRPHNFPIGFGFTKILCLAVISYVSSSRRYDIAKSWPRSSFPSLLQLSSSVTVISYVRYAGLINHTAHGRCRASLSKKACTVARAAREHSNRIFALIKNPHHHPL